MLKEQVYIETASNFGTSVGVATIIGYTKKKDVKKEFTDIEEYKSVESDLEVNYIILDSIELGLYQQLQREVYKIERGNKRFKKELSIYKRAFDIVTNE